MKRNCCHTSPPAMLCNVLFILWGLVSFSLGSEQHCLNSKLNCCNRFRPLLIFRCGWMATWTTYGGTQSKWIYEVEMDDGTNSPQFFILDIVKMEWNIQLLLHEHDTIMMKCSIPLFKTSWVKVAVCCSPSLPLSVVSYISLIQLY